MLLVILDFANNMTFNYIMLHITLVALKKAIFLNILTIFTPRPNFSRLSCHSPIKLSILWEAVDERHEGIAYLHQAMAGFGVGDVAHLLLRYVEKRCKLFPVACGLVVHDYEFGVGEHASRGGVVQQIFHVLRNARGEGVALAEPAPGGGEEHAAVRVLIHNMELIKVYMGATARPPVLRHAVENRIRYNKQTHCLELLPKVENIVYQNAALSVHIGRIGESIKAALGEKLQRER